MSHIEKTVFISYRRTNAFIALAVFKELSAHGYDVFFDYTSISSGDFEQIIIENINARAHFIVILTPSALERCGETGDWFRREIETAMETKRNIIPLMFEGFDFNNPSSTAYLTGNLASLKQYNALRVPADYFDAAMQRLRQDFLNVPLDAILHPLSKTASQVAYQQQVAANSASIQHFSATEWSEQGCNASDPEEKLRCFTAATQLDPSYAAAYHNRARVHQDQGNLSAALRDFDQAIRLDPNYVSAYKWRGNVYATLGELDAALQDFNQAIQLDPGFYAAYNNRGFAFQKIGNLAAALRDYDQAVQLDPYSPHAYYNRARLYTEQGDHESAVSDYDRVIQLDPKYISAYINRGNLYKAQDNLEAALLDYDNAIQLDPNTVSAYINRGNLYYKQNNFTAAMRDYDKAIQLRPMSAIAYNSRGNLYYKLDNFSAALHDYDKAIQLDPKYATAYYNRGTAYKSQGNLAAAIQNYQAYLEVGGSPRSKAEQTIRELKQKLSI